MHFQKPPLGTPLDWENPLNKGIVLHLAMNEGHGDKMQDLSLYGNHGTLYNFAFPPTAASGWNPGQTGVGLNFDGTNDYVHCGSNASSDIPGDVSYFCWIKKTDVSSQYILTKSISATLSAHQYVLFTQPDNALRFTQGNPNYSHVIEDSPSIVAGAWHPVGFTKEGTDINIYNNGVVVKNGSVAGNPASNSDPFCIGLKVASSYHFNGSIDQVRILNRTATPKEVKEYTINPWQVYLDE